MEDINMFHLLNKLFGRESIASECSIIREKLGKRIHRPVEEIEDYCELLHVSDVDADSHAMSTKTMVEFWQDRDDPSLVSRIRGEESHMRYSMNTSETLFQPGSAETFSLCRQHPADELTARRNRTTATNLPSQFLRRSGRFQRIAS
jgi:hypothetical protein